MKRRISPWICRTPSRPVKFRLEQQGADKKALIGIIGNRTRVYEVLRRDRALSLAMIRQLNHQLKMSSRSPDPACAYKKREQAA